LGGHPVGRQQDRTDRIAVIRTAIDAGITLLENCRA
jgi:hypothetical protein